MDKSTYITQFALEPTKPKSNQFVYWMSIIFAIGFILGVFTASEYMVQNIKPPIVHLGG